MKTVVHLDGYFDNPTGDFSIERRVVEQAGGRFLAERDPESAKRQAAEAKVVLFRAAKVDETFIRTLGNCRALIRYGIGLDKVDISSATKHGIAVCNVPDFCIQEMADHTLALALSLFRRLKEYAISAVSADWTAIAQMPLRSAGTCRFTTIGYGRIARAVLQRAGAFGFQCMAADPYVSAETMAADGVEAVSVEEAFSRADLVSLHCPLTEKTRFMVDRERLRGMKAGAILINTARGALVDTEALADALEARALGGAGLDVTEPEPLPAGHRLYSFPNVIITPHMAWFSDTAEVRLRQFAAEEAARALGGKPLHYQVNS